jgi:cysteinyl-tRNA synthetase
MSGTKMAKSTGNIARVGEVLDSGVDPRALRYALIAVHYRAALNYAPDSLTAAAAAVDRLDALLASLATYREDRPDDPSLPDALANARAAFDAAMDDDLNVSAALAAVFDLVRDLNRRIDSRALSTADAGRAIDWLRTTDTVLGVLPDAADDLEPALRSLLDDRVAARAARDWAASDRLRDELATHGIAVEDTRDGQRWRRLVEAGRD